MCIRNNSALHTPTANFCWFFRFSLHQHFPKPPETGACVAWCGSFFCCFWFLTFKTPTELVCLGVASLACSTCRIRYFSSYWQGSWPREISLPLPHRQSKSYPVKLSFLEFWIVGDTHTEEMARVHFLFPMAGAAAAWNDCPQHLSSRPSGVLPIIWACASSPFRFSKSPIKALHSLAETPFT